MKVVILGAGPAGLGAARELQRAGADWLLLERSCRPGGLAASFEKDGFTWDIGGHILFSHYPYFDQALDEIIPPADWHSHERLAFIRIHDVWVPYPFQYNIRYLPADEQRRCVEGVRDAAGGPGRVPSSFEDWIYRSMGRGLGDLFMIPYNTKVWAGPPKGMSSTWVGDRVAVPDVERMQRHLVDGRDDVSWGPNNRFRFPKGGGTGAIWSRLAASLPSNRLRFNQEAVAVLADCRVVVTAGGDEVPYDILISTIPLDRLIALGPFREGAWSTGGLVRTRTWVGGVGVRGLLPAAAQGKCWMYFPEPEYPFYRVTVFSHYSPENAPAGCYSLMAEVSSRPGEPVPDDAELMKACIRGLKRCGLMDANAEPVHTWSYLADYGYPVPTPDRDAILADVLPRLERMGVYSRGRFGAWKYEVGNMDHAFMQGVEAARHILTGADEETVWHPDRVNAPRREGPGRS